MIELVTTITHTEKRTLKLQTPAFFKAPASFYDEYIGVLDEKTFIKILYLNNGDNLYLEHKTVESGAKDILEAQAKWNVINEEEFMKAYDDMYESMRLQPKLFTIGTEKEEAIKQAITL